MKKYKHKKITPEQLVINKRKRAADERRLKQIALQRRAILEKVLDGSTFRLPKGERRYNQYRAIYEELRITDKYKKLKDECYDTNFRTGNQQFLLTLERAAWRLHSKRLQMWKSQAKPKVGRSPDNGCIDCGGELTMIGKGIYKCKDCSSQNHLNKKCPACGNMGCVNLGIGDGAPRETISGGVCHCWGCQNCGGTQCRACRWS